MKRVFIDGEAGTTGLQILERLRGRRDLELVHIDPSERKDEERRAELLRDSDVSILCLPDDAARRAVELADGAGRLIDASTAHRTTPGWTYEFPELDDAQAAAIAASNRVSNPGCYANASVAIVRPLVANGLVPPDHPIVINAVSGYSGGGRTLIAAFEDAEAMDPISTAFHHYGLDLDHKHVPEIQLHGGLSTPPLFLPSIGRFAQGVIVTVPLHLWALPASPSTKDVQASRADHYAPGPGDRGVVVRSMEDSSLIKRLDPESLRDTDHLELHVFGNDDRQHAVICGVLDNLGRGAAGQAVRNLELMLGL